MAAFSRIDDSVRALAQRNHSFALKTMGTTVTHTEAARLLGVSPSVVSDYKGDDLERACQLLAAFNIKLVNRDERTWPADEIAALRVFARKGMDADPEASDWGAL